MVARAIGGYDQLHVSWSSPGGSWSTLRLVRNAYGVPVSESDGVVLVESNSGPTATGTIDAPVRQWFDNDLDGGSFAYYAIWLYSTATAEWVRAAYCTGLALRDYGYSERLWELTPQILRTKTSGLLDQDNDELKAYESIFAYQLDGIRGEYETLRDVNNPEKVSGNLLPLMAQQYGQFFEPELGMQQMRLLLQNTVHLYRNKGTVPGIEAFVSAISGFGADVQPFVNLMLDYNDSSAEEGVGRWVGATNATVSRYVADNIINSVPDAIGSTMRNVGILQVTAGAAGLVRARCGFVSPLYYGIPVTAGTSYTFSMYARGAAASPPGVALRIYYFDVTGAYIGEGVGGTTAITNTAWTRVVATVGAPTGASYAAVAVEWTSTGAGQTTYFDAGQFEAGTAATAYTDARLIDIFVRGERVNLATNPNFETDTTGWAAEANTTIARSTAQFHSGVASLLVTHSSAGAAVSATLHVATVAGTTYTVSGWVRRAAGTQGVSLTTNNGGTPTFVAAPTAWTRISQTFTAGTTDTVLFFFNASAAGVASTGTGSAFYLDDVLVEVGSDMRPYFDGTTYAFSGESIWEGAANGSRSHLYPQRRTKNARMTALLPDYTPMGSSFRLLYAQPI